MIVQLDPWDRCFFYEPWIGIVLMIVIDIARATRNQIHGSDLRPSCSEN